MEVQNFGAKTMCLLRSQFPNFIGCPICGNTGEHGEDDDRRYYEREPEREPEREREREHERERERQRERDRDQQRPRPHNSGHQLEPYVTSEGGRTVLNCNTDNANTPLTWIRVGGLPLSHHAYQTHNILVIEITTIDDAGVYRCFEQRPNGHENLITELEIIVIGMDFLPQQLTT